MWGDTEGLMGGRWQLSGAEILIQSRLNRMYYDANLLFSWFYSMICGRRVTPRFHLFVSDVCQGNEEAK